MDRPQTRSGLLMFAVAFLLFIATGAQATVSLIEKEAIKKHQKASRSLKLGIPHATGSMSLIDAGGLKYFINTNITFSTSSSASGAMSEASYQAPVAASTSAGGTTMSTLNDAFDGYNTLCVSLTNATGPCATGNAAYTIYNKNGPAVFDATVPAGPLCTSRQVAFPAQTIGALSVQRKVFVPTNDTFGRWLNIFTNTSGAPVTFTMITANNLGSDSNTKITMTSSGDLTATTADNWVASFQNFSGNKSSDPREGHVLWGPGASTPMSGIHFVDGDDNPYWSYSITLAAGQTKIIMNFVTALATKAAAHAKADRLMRLLDASTDCMSATEKNQVVNFVTAAPDMRISLAGLPATATVGVPYSGTYTCTNGGTGAASGGTTCTVSGLPAGVTDGSCTISPGNAAWVAGNPVPVGQTVTCTVSGTPTAADGTTVTGTTGATGDSTPVNNSATLAIFGLVSAVPVPALGWLGLLMLALVLGVGGYSGFRFSNHRRER